jgi:hypothetical protein
MGWVVRYADDLELLAKEETIIQSMIDKTEVGREYENMTWRLMWKKTKAMRISR